METSPPAPLLRHDVIAVEQRARLFELTNLFTLRDQAGAEIGAVAQVGQTWFAKLVRIFSELDVALPMRLEVRDPAGTPVLVLDKPWFRMQTTVTGGDGAPIGRITKQLRLGKARFGLLDPVGGQLGSVHALNWRAKDFSIRDAADVEVARITKKWRGLLTEAFTDADTYVIELRPDLVDPLRSLALAAALAVDTILKQRDAGG